MKAGLRSLMLVPLVWQGSTYGVISFRAIDPDAFGEHQISVGQQIASQIAGAIITAHQYLQLERESREREQLTEIQRIASSSLNIEEMFEAFADRARQLVPADRLVLTVLDTSSEIISRHTSGMDFREHGSPTLSPEIRAGLYDLIDSQQSHFVANAEEYENALVRLPEEVSRYAAGLRSMLSLPLVRRGDLVGILTFRSKDPQAYGPRQIESAEQIAIHIAGAIHASIQFTNLENESRERDQLAEISRIVSSTLELESVFNSFAEAAKKLVPFDRLAISIVDVQANQTWDAHVTGQKISRKNMAGPYTLQDSVVPAEVYRDHQIYVANAERLLERSKTDVSDDNRVRIAAGLITAMFVPVVLQGSVVGTLVFRSRQSDPYHESEIALAERIAGHIAGVIAASQQLTLLEQESAERRRLAEEQSRIAALGRIVSSTLDIDEVFARFVEESKELLPFDRIAIITLSEDKSYLIDSLVQGIDSSTAPAGAVLSIGDNPLQKKVFSTGIEIVLSGEAYEEFARTEPAEKVRLDAGLFSVLMSPMIWQGEVIGVINFRSTLRDAYGESEVSIAKQICAQIAGAIAVSKQYGLLEQESAERRRLAEEQSRIAEIGRIVSSTIDIEQVFSLVVEEAHKLLQFERVAIVLLNDERTELTDVLIEGVGQFADPIGAQHPLGFNPLHQQVINSQTSFFSNADDDRKTEEIKEFEKHLYELGLISVLVSPLKWKQEVIGVIALRSSDSHPYDEHHVNLAEQIAAQIAGAVATSNQYRLLEEALSEVQLQAAALEAADDAIIIRSADATALYVNPGFETQTGFSKDEVLGTKFLYPEHNNFSPEEIDSVWDLLRKGEPWRKTVSSIRKDGSEYVADASLTPIFNDAGEFDKSLGIRRDVTARVKAEDALRIQAAALEEASDAVIVLRPDTTIGYVNNAFVDQTGYSKEEIVGNKSIILRPKSSVDGDAQAKKIWALVNSGKVWRGTQLSQRKDGSIFTIDASLNPVMAEDGTISGFVSIRRDITDQIRAEQDRQARAELDAQNQQLQEINNQREEFFSSVSHELRTPLTAVTAFSDILSRNRAGNLTGGQLDQLDVIKRNSRSLINLVEDMLDMSRLNNRSLRIDRLPMNLDEMIVSVVESLEPTAEERGQTLSFSSNTAGVWINADKGRLIQTW